MNLSARLLTAILFCALASVYGPAVAVDAAPPRLRVLSYNIHHGEGTDGKLDLARIARVIESAEPDVVGLQEVDNNTERTGHIDQLAELSRLTKMHVAFGGNIPLQGGQYGNAVLSKQPIARHENHLLPHLDNGEQRGVLQAEIDVGGGRSVVVLCTHFDHRRPDAERVESAKAINERAAKLLGQSLLLVGDLNDVPESTTLRTLAQRWSRANDKILPTSPSQRPVRQIDYVLLAPADRWKVVEVRVLEESIASDHRPLLAVLEFVGE